MQRRSMLVWTALALLIGEGLLATAAQAQRGRAMEANKALVRRYYAEVYGRGNIAAIDAFVAPNFTGHNYLDQSPSSRESLRQFVIDLRRAFPDIRFQIEDQIAAGDKVVTRWTMRGTHKGPLRDLAPTGKQVQMPGLILHRFEGGKIVEAWANADELGLMRQLGALPAAASGRTPLADERASQKTLYERLGGVYAIATVVDDFIERLLVNDILNANPRIRKARDTVPKAGLKFRVTAFLSEAAGGPQKYTGRSMKESHEHLNITEREWRAMLTDLRATLEKFRVPEREQQEIFALVESTRPEIVTGTTRADEGRGFTRGGAGASAPTERRGSRR